MTTQIIPGKYYLNSNQVREDVFIPDTANSKLRCWQHKSRSICTAVRRLSDCIYQPHKQSNIFYSYIRTELRLFAYWQVGWSHSSLQGFQKYFPCINSLFQIDYNQTISSGGRYLRMCNIQLINKDFFPEVFATAITFTKQPHEDTAGQHCFRVQFSIQGNSNTLTAISEFPSQ